MNRHAVPNAPLSRTRLAALLLTGALAGAALLPDPASGQEAADSARNHRHAAPSADAAEHGAPLREPGNAAFAAVAEVVAELNARDDTDWSRVDLEALRRHLRDMQRFTLEAEVAERENVDGGLRVVVDGPDEEARAAIRRALEAHAPMLEEETGWAVDVAAAGDATALRVVADDPVDVERIRGLGYIGLMATGAHHRRHHWMIATGREPHGG